MTSPQSLSKASHVPHLLIVEDNPGDVDLILDALQQTGRAHTVATVHDGLSAIEALQRAADGGATPDFVLLDLNIPKLDGREVLRVIKGDPRLSHIPVAVLTSSQADRDVEQAYQLHANCFMTKPSDVRQLFEMFDTFTEFWFDTATVAFRASPDQATD